MTKRRRFAVAPFDHGEPIARASLAPLVAVSLAIIVSLAAALPQRTHALTFDISWGRISEPYPHDIPTVSLDIDRTGRVTLDGDDVAQSNLHLALQTRLEVPIQPILNVTPDGQAAYGDVYKALGIISASPWKAIYLCTPQAAVSSIFSFGEWPKDNEVGKARLESTECVRFMPAPVVRFEPEPLASYDASVQVINLANEAGVTKFAFAGNEKYQVFGKGD